MKHIKFTKKAISVCVIFLLVCSGWFARKKYDKPNKIINALPVVHLNRYYHFTHYMRDPELLCRVERYRSSYDMSTQSVMILESDNTKPKRLFFFFHGMDGDCGDGFVVMDLVKKLNAKVICLGGRGPAWISDSFLSDAVEVIRKYCSKDDRFYLIGVSMGGTQILSLAGLLPDELRSKIAGVLALIPGTNLQYIVDKGMCEKVKTTLIDSIEGDLSSLQKKSPSSLMHNYRKNLPFVLFRNERDTVLPIDNFVGYIKEWRQNNHVAVIMDQGEHNFNFSNFDYKKAFELLGKNITVTYESFSDKSRF